MTHSFEPLPPLDGLSAVTAAARTGSLTAAAEELGLTHSAVSRRIASVEAWLGAELFERHARGVRPTPAGMRLVRAVEDAFGLIRAAAEPWRAGQGPRTVRISVVPAFARLWLLPRLAALQGDPPDLRIEPRPEHGLAQLDGADADLAIRYGLGDWPGLNAIPLIGETLVAVASPALAARLAGERPADLLALPLINDSDPRQWRLWFSGLGVRYRPRAMDRRFEDYDLVLAAAEAGLGLALLRRPLGEERLAEGALVQVSGQVVASPAGHHIVLRPDEDRPEIARLVSRLRHLGRSQSRPGKPLPPGD